MIKESTLNHPDIIYFQIWINRLRIQENWTWYRSNMYYVYARYMFCKESAEIYFVAFEDWPENCTATWLTQFLQSDGYVSTRNNIHVKRIAQWIRNKTFLFVKIETWNFKNLYNLGFCETLKNFIHLSWQTKFF